MTTFLKNRDMKFSFHLLLTCIALTACGEKLRIGAHAVAVAGAYDPGAGVQFEIAAVAGRDFAGARHDPVIGGRFAALAAGRERDAGQQQVE